MAQKPVPERPEIPEARKASKPVPSQPVIVGFSQVADAFGGREAAHAAVADAASDAVAPGDEAAFRAVMARALAAMEDAQTTPGVFATPDDQAGSLLQTFLAERAAEEGKVVATQVGTLEAKFDDHDWWGWVHSTGWKFLKSKLGLRHRARFPGLPGPADTRRLPNGARVAILGDWGTGLYGAPRCANSIATDPDGFAAVVHLGDVYYSGSDNEVEQHFLNQWPWLGGDVVNRACNSNHEMYSGGGPYFKRTLPRFGQSSSVFRLETDHWVVAGLDTGYDDHDLRQGQAPWLESVVRELDGRHLVLFSHHQLFSRLDSQGPKLASGLGSLLAGNQVFAWYWGHEHRLALYDQHPTWGLHARCVGHGGYPYFREDRIQGPRQDVGDGQELVRMDATDRSPGVAILDGPNPFIDDHGEKYGPNGYMVIELADDGLHETLHSPEGFKLWENTLVPEL